MNTVLTLLAFLPLLQTSQPTGPTELPTKKRVFTPFNHVFFIVEGGREVDSIALYLIEPGPFPWKGRRQINKEWRMRVQETGFESREPLATFNRRRFEFTFDAPGIYALAFFHDGKEEWKRHFFFFDSKWSDPRYIHSSNLTLYKRADIELEDINPGHFRSVYHSVY